MFEYFIKLIPEVDSFIIQTLGRLKVQFEDRTDPVNETTEEFFFGHKSEVRNIVTNPKPLYDAILKGELIGFGFFGDRSLPLKRCDYLMESDQKACDILDQYPDIYAYISYKKDGQHNWGNIVFVKNFEAIYHFMAKSGHLKSTASLSPNWFKGVMKPSFTCSYQDNEWKVSWKSLLTIDNNDDCFREVNSENLARETSSRYLRQRHDLVDYFSKIGNSGDSNLNEK